MKSSILFLSLLFLGSCDLLRSGDDYSIDDLEELRAEITALAESETCTNSEEWDFVAFGSKPCGGPREYLAYSTQIDVSEFLDLVSKYNELDKQNNQSTGAASDCLFVGPPNGVVCEDGKPVLV